MTNQPQKEEETVSITIRLSPEEAADFAALAKGTWKGHLSELALHYFRAGRDLCTGRSNSTNERLRSRHVC
jgi:hypothetical protein